VHFFGCVHVASTKLCICGVGVGAAVGLTVGVGVGVTVGLTVGVGVGVTVGLTVGVGVGVTVGLTVGVGVEVLVIIGILVGVIFGVSSPDEGYTAKANIVSITIIMILNFGPIYFFIIFCHLVIGTIKAAIIRKSIEDTEKKATIEKISENTVKVQESMCFNLFI